MKKQTNLNQKKIHFNIGDKVFLNFSYIALKFWLANPMKN